MGTNPRGGTVRSFAAGFGGLCARIGTHPRTALMVVLLLSMSWMAVQIYSELVVARIPTAVFDLDQSRLSRMLWTSISAPREIEIAETPASLDEAWERLADGRLGAVVVIPRGLADDVKRGREAAVMVAVDGGNILIGKNVFKALAKAIGQVSAGVQVTTLRKQGARKERSVAMVAPIATDERPIRNPSTNYGIYVVPGLLFFLLHVFVLLLGLTVWLPEHRPANAAGALGALAAAFVFCTAVGVAFAYLWLRGVSIVPATGAGWVLGWIAALVALDLLMATAFVAVSRNALAAVEITVLLGMLSMMLSGITWPTDRFPEPLQWLATWIPFTPFARGLQSMLHIPAGMDELGAHLGTFARQGALFGAIAAGGFGGRRLLAGFRARRTAGEATP